jgi:outer membrane protein assembly factor BamB
MLRRSFLAFSSISLSSLLADFARSSDPLVNNEWRNWRGLNRDGMLHNNSLPTSLDPERLVRIWSKSLGDSYSGPLLTANAVFTTESDSGKERVYAFSRENGNELWKYEWDGKLSVPFFAARNGSWIRSTPATDGKRLFVGGIRDLLVAIDCQSGKEIWRVDFAKMAGKVPDFGMVCSPLLDGEHLYIQAGNSVHKLNSADGSIVWSSMKDNGDMMSSGAFSSPIIDVIKGTRQLVVQSRTKLAGLNLDTGSPLWTHEVAAFRGMNILTPTVWNNAIFTSSYGGKSILLDFESTPKVRWDNKVEGYMSSPIKIENYVYMHLKNKRFACMDLNTGKELWVTTPFGEYWSMVSDGNRILALDQNGTLRLIEHNPSKFTLLSERKVSEEEAWAHVAVAGNNIAIRSQNALQLFKFS